MMKRGKRESKREFHRIVVKQQKKGTFSFQTHLSSALVEDQLSRLAIDWVKMKKKRKSCSRIQRRQEETKEWIKFLASLTGHHHHHHHHHSQNTQIVQSKSWSDWQTRMDWTAPATKPLAPKMCNENSSFQQQRRKPVNWVECVCNVRDSLLLLVSHVLLPPKLVTKQTVKQSEKKFQQNWSVLSSSISSSSSSSS